jgi:site-specific DNA-methyltransferase (adenine-specific)
MDTLKTNVLYYGDNLEILRKHIPENSIDLVYLDPPFNSKKDYNILFKENGGVESEAQIKAFTDTWHWTQTAENTYHDIVTNGPLKVGQLIGALHDAIGQNDVMAYLVMMATRLIELHRVLKPSGSLYLHCDPTASHYLKLVLDQIFGPVNFRNEIVWQKIRVEKAQSKQFAKLQDTIFWYTKADEYIFNQQRLLPSEEYTDKYYSQVEPETGRRYQLISFIQGGQGSARRFGDRLIEPPQGKHWIWTQERIDKAMQEGLLVFTDPNKPRLKRYLDEHEGRNVGTIWSDIFPINAVAKERLGYETQKPLALLERIIKASSNDGDVVLDPFCGCGTALVAAQKLNRRWIGIDITHLAITLMRNRLKDSFGIDAEVVGEPVDLASAKTLARQDRYQFQWWALGLIKARPLGEKKKGADKGIDGVIQFIDDPTGKPKRAVVQVKSGHVAVNAIRELKAVAAHDALGIFITLEPPTVPMQTEAIGAGFYHSPGWDKDYPKIQILTIEELLHGKIVDMPPQTQTSVTFTKAPKVSKKEGEQLNMGDTPE